MMRGMCIRKKRHANGRGRGAARGAPPPVVGDHRVEALGLGAQYAAEYERESIEWDRTAFPDNMPCIELLSKKPHGLLRVLDNECLRGMAASDGDKLVSKFNKQHGSHPNFDVCGPASVFRRKVRFLEVVGGGEAGPCAKYATKIDNRVGCSRLLRANRMGSAPRRTTS